MGLTQPWTRLLEQRGGQSLDPQSLGAELLWPAGTEPAAGPGAAVSVPWGLPGLCLRRLPVHVWVLRCQIASAAAARGAGPARSSGFWLPPPCFGTSQAAGPKPGLTASPWCTAGATLVLAPAELVPALLGRSIPGAGFLPRRSCPGSDFECPPNPFTCRDLPCHSSGLRGSVVPLCLRGVRTEGAVPSLPQLLFLAPPQGRAAHPCCAWSPSSVPSAAPTSPRTGNRRRTGRSCASSA